MIFVDTSAWYAIEVEDDLNHQAAHNFLTKIASGKFGIAITTDYIIDETLTLLRTRRDLASALSFIDKVTKSKSIRVFWINEDLFQKTLEVFKKSNGKTWNFTDCTSFALMRELNVKDAFSFDAHFNQAGFSMLPKE
ncbi:MAG: type II toxin-antitoxin system VapC family toxin [Candidatus Bathyarchaeota archaeon]|nr:type II toxin-antitoxin system VapC family toxin [Candidatus Bathyarchaeota archaeon]